MAKTWGLRCDVCGLEVQGDDGTPSLARRMFRTVSILEPIACRQESARDVCGDCHAKVLELLRIPADGPPTERGRPALSDE